MVEIGSVSSTDLFVGSERHPFQIQCVRIEAAPGHDGEPVTVWIEGAGVSTPEPATVVGLRAGESREAEVPVAVDPGRAAGSRLEITVRARCGADQVSRTAEMTVSEPGWTMVMVPHFHYDPFWWNTQAGYLATWDDQPQVAQDGRKPGQAAGFQLVRTHLDLAARDPDHKFVLAGLDYLKPYWDAHPWDRAELARLIAAGRVEVVGGMYNEPNTNLTSLESTLRNILHGTRYQRDLTGEDPDIGWMLDVFGHDPSLPAALADAGLNTVATARGPFHRWGPSVTTGDTSGMQFPTEFEWIAPDGRGVLCGYLAHHYPAGWRLNEVDTLEEAEAEAYQRFQSLKKAAATRNVILPVGYNHVVPARWTTEIHRDWRKRYVWPRFVCGLPSEFFARVRAEATLQGARFSPQSRDMNPVYPGKEVSYIDVKQAHRAGETTLLDAERLATLASLLGARFPAGAVDKAWRQLLFCSHHDGITGVASDQVYLDLSGGWREAYELAAGVRREAVAHLAARVDTRGDGEALVVVNAQSWARTDLVGATVEFAAPGPAGVALCDDAGGSVPVTVTGAGRHADGTLASATLTFVAADVPAGGYRVFRVLRGDGPAEPGWRPAPGNRAESDMFLLEADPARGGALRRILDKRAGRELLRDGESGAAVVLDDEYGDHPEFGKGPWHIVPTGVRSSSEDVPATVRAEVSPAGRRLVSVCRIGDLRVTTEATLWHGLDRVEFSTRLDGSIGQDRLARVRFPFAAAGARPVYEVGNAVIGRTFGYTDVDVKEHPFVLDCPAYTWAGLSSAARVALHDGGVTTGRYAIGVAEIVAAGGGTDEDGGAVRDLVAALAAQGVTATTSMPDGGRYGSLSLDSNLPDVRLSIGGPDRNPFTARILAQAGAGYAAALHERLEAEGTALLWIPASPAPTWAPGTDVCGERALPVLVVAGRGDAATARAVAALVADLADATIEVHQPAALPGLPAGEQLADYSVAVLNRGTPGVVVEPDGTLSVSLMRSSGGWPTGTWIDGPRRAAPDGSSFALQHWSHTFEYAVAGARGDWREAGFVRAGHAYNSAFTARAEPAHDGILPAAGSSLLSAEPENVIVTAFKPKAEGDGLVVRCYETAGRPTRARIRSFVPLRDAVLADVRERPGDRLPVSGAEVCLDLTSAATATVIAAAPAFVPQNELEPVFSRYWLHNKGAAPLGESPAMVYLDPPTVDLGTEVTVRVTVSATRAVKGTVRLVVPPQISVDHVDLDFDFDDGYRQFEVRLRPMPGADAGICHLAARVVTPDGQEIEDVCAVRLGDAVAGPPVAVTVRTPAVEVSPGGAGEIRVELANLRADEVRGEAQLITPFGTWDLAGPWTRAFRLGAGARDVVAYQIDVPQGSSPAEFWALVKVMAFGTVAYTETIRVTVRP